MPVPIYYQTNRKGISFPVEDSNQDGSGERTAPQAISIIGIHLNLRTSMSDASLGLILHRQNFANGSLLDRRTSFVA